MAQKHGGGRPTDYDPSYCDKIIEWGKQGKSRAWMCSRLSIARSTMQLWEKVHPEFSAALTLATEHAQALWEDMGQDNILQRDFNSSVWSRSMAARFPRDWREKTAFVGGDENDSPIEMKVSAADDFTRRIAGLAARAGENAASGQSDD